MASCASFFANTVCHIQRAEKTQANVAALQATTQWHEHHHHHHHEHRHCSSRQPTDGASPADANSGQPITAASVQVKDGRDRKRSRRERFGNFVRELSMSIQPLAPNSDE